MATETSTLQVVRQRRTGAVLFLKKPSPPFKHDPPREFPDTILPNHNINNSSIEFPRFSEEKVVKDIKNLKPPDNSFSSKNAERREFSSVDAECVLFQFGNNYGFKQAKPLPVLEKRIPIPKYSSFRKGSEKKPEPFIYINQESRFVKDARNLSDEVYKLSSEEDMINEFLNSNLF